MQPKATTVNQYLAELPADRREAVTAVRNTILKNLDKGYTERMSYGMIGYAVPHSIFPAGYHCDPRQPLPFAGLASQKQHMSLYMMGVSVACDGEHVSEMVAWFKNAWAKSGKKPLDMGVACIRFKKLDDIPLDVIGEAVRRMPLKKFIESYERTLETMAEAKAKRSTPKGKPSKAAPKKAAKKIAKKSASKAKK